jgi:transposase
MSKKPSKTDLEKLDTASLVKLLLQAFDKIQTLALETELEKLKRKNARQAAPFSRNTVNPNSQPPGGKVGEGTFTYKTPPTPNEVTAIIEVPLLEVTCPKCSDDLPSTPSSTRVAFLLEMPVVTQQISEYRLEHKVCKKCGITVTAKHTRVATDQTGATAFRVSPEVMAIAHVLQYEKGIPARKVPFVLELTLQIQLGQSAITQAALTNSLETKVISKSYKTIRNDLLKDEQINTDDTSWRVNGKDSYLMTAVSKNAVVFQIRSRHKAKEVLEMIPSSYQGVKGTDRFKSYNVPAFAGVKQQKCLHHIIKNLKAELESLKGRARDYPLKLKKLFQQAIKVHQKYTTQSINLEQYTKRAKVIRGNISKLLAPRRIQMCSSSQRIRVGLEYHHARGNLLRFLEHPDVSPTNNAAERALRHNVIFRKLCGGSKSDSGARALEAYSTVIQTAKRRGQNPVTVLAELYAEQVAKGHQSHTVR